MACMESSAGRAPRSGSMRAAGGIGGRIHYVGGEGRLEAIIMLVVLAVLAVPVALVLLLLAVLGLKRRVADLERAVDALQQAHAAPASAAAPGRPAPAQASGPAVAEPVRPRAVDATPAAAVAQAPASDAMPPPLPAARATTPVSPGMAGPRRRPNAEDVVLDRKSGV